METNVLNQLQKALDVVDLTIFINFDLFQNAHLMWELDNEIQKRKALFTFAEKTINPEPKLSEFVDKHKFNQFIKSQICFQIT